jgi:hypothetical protein
MYRKDGLGDWCSRPNSKKRGWLFALHCQLVQANNSSCSWASNVSFHGAFLVAAGIPRRHSALHIAEEILAMKTQLVVGLVAGALLYGLTYYEEFEATYELPAEYSQGPEALSWLRENGSESALASNRFGETQNAVEFVQQLYRAGATRVIIPLAAIQSDEAETYADAVVVSLPPDSAKRDGVWRLCAEELRRIGEDPDDSPDDDLVLLWCD